MATSILGFDLERCQAPASMTVSMGEEDSRHLIRSVLSMTTGLLQEKNIYGGGEKLLICLFGRNYEKNHR